ncbi:MAG: hypothetical protein AABZ14_08955, partial [Candidatus Margulisiibacteriota bacterium]
LIIPRHPGTITIPRLEWTCFDPSSHTFIVRQAPSFQLRVQKNQGKPSSMVLSPTPIKNTVESEHEDIRYIKHSLGSFYTLQGQRWKLLVLILNIILWMGMILYRPVRWIYISQIIHHPDRQFSLQMKLAAHSTEAFHSIVYDALNQAGRSRNLTEAIVADLRYFEAKKYAPQEAVTAEGSKNQELLRARRLYKEIQRCSQK